MRSIRMLAVVTGTLVLASACGDGGGTPPPDNQPPVAGFSEVCTGLSCVFTDASTDPDGNATITAWNWTFGDNSTVNVKSPPAHVYATAGTYTVGLTVTDDAGATNAFSKSVTVPAGNAPPVANFTAPSCTVNVPCPFTDASSDDVAVTGWSWDFNGDGTAEATTEDASFTYTAAGTFSVILTVTDGGGLTDDVTQPVTVAPSASVLCSPTSPTADGRPRLNCTLEVTERATLTITVTSRDCEIGGNKFEIIQPIQETLFFNGCIVPAGTQYTPAAVFEAGTQVVTRFTQGGGLDEGDPIPGPPEIRLEGAYPEWTLHIDDGGAPSEPRNDDILLTVTATRVQ